MISIASEVHQSLFYEAAIVLFVLKEIKNKTFCSLRTKSILVALV